MIPFNEFITKLEQEPPISCDFAVGDTVTFTNEHGLSFPDCTITGFDTDTDFHGRFIYLDIDAYWFPHRPDELTKQ